LSISVLTFIKWRLTPSYAAKDTIFWQKRPKTIVIRIIVWMTIFKSIHMAFYVNTSTIWKMLHFYSSLSLNPSKCAFFHVLTVFLLPKNHMLFIVSKQCVCSRRVHIEGHMNSCRWMERTQGSATRQISRWSGKNFAWLLLIGKPNMLHSFLNRFSYFMNLWWCLWSFSAIWKMLHFYSSLSLNPSKCAFFHVLTVFLLPKNHMLFIVSSFSYFMNLWWCLWSFSVDINQYM
jgi:hypothetical protein